MILKLMTLALTALVVIPSGAHLLELPAKIGMAEADYFTVQSIYAGWALFAVVIVAAILANGLLSWTMRRSDRRSSAWALASALLVCLTLVVFFIWVFPGNQATENWTAIPADWRTLRRNWEYGHAVNAGLAFTALLATGRAIIGSAGAGDRRHDGPDTEPRG